MIQKSSVQPDSDEPIETVLQDLASRDGAPLALTQGLVDADAGQALAIVDQRMQFYSEVRQRTVKLTLPQDWVDFDGKPYLQATGAERLKPLWGIYIRGLKIEPSLDETRRRLRGGEHVSVEVTGTVGSRVTGEDSEFLGGRSSDDKWFADRRGGIQEVDPEDLRRAALSNFEVNGITRLLGLRGLTWPDLEKYGIRRDQASGRVDYKKGGQSTGAAESASLAQEVQEKLEACHGSNALEALYLLTKFTDKEGKLHGLKTWEALGKASDKWMARIIEKVRAEYTSHQARTAKAEPSADTPMGTA